MPAKAINPDKLTINLGVWGEISRALRLEGLASQTIDNYYWVLRDLDALGIDARYLTRADAERAVEFWQEKRAANSAAVRKAIFKKIAKLLDGRELGKGEYPEVVKWISTTRGKKRRFPRVLTKEKVRKLVDAAESQRDRALLFTLYESGMRAREFLSLNIGDVTFDKYGAVLRLVEREGSRLKTGERRVRLFGCIPDLQLWINMHPERENPEAPLWLTRGPNANGRMVINSLDEIVRKYSERAGIGPVHPHLLRHSRATHLANCLTESQLSAVFGWVQGTRMASCYVHLSGKDVDRALLKAHGIEEGGEEAQEDKALAPAVCPRCGEKNPAGFKFCGKCGMLLSEKEITTRPEEITSSLEGRIKELEETQKKLLGIVENYRELREAEIERVYFHPTTPIKNAVAMGEVQATPSGPPFTCRSCNTTFDSQKELDIHVESVRGHLVEWDRHGHPLPRRP